MKINKKIKRTWTYKKDVQIKFTYCDVIDRWVARYNFFVIQFYKFGDKWVCRADRNDDFSYTRDELTRTKAIKRIIDCIEAVS